jgi:hypothetical protein
VKISEGIAYLFYLQISFISLLVNNSLTLCFSIQAWFGTVMKQNFFLAKEMGIWISSVSKETHLLVELVSQQNSY